MAEIHPRLQADCVVIGKLPLCHLLLSNDSNYPWFILVPDRDSIQEIFELDQSDQAQLIEESCALSRFLMRDFQADKLNIAALGNQVPQLHLHHILRYVDDPAWPAPIWGKLPPIPYSANEIQALSARIACANLPGFELAQSD